MKPVLIVGIAAAFVSLTTPATSAQARYALTPLASLGEPGGEAFSVNRAGRTAGSSFTRYAPCGGGLLCSNVHAVLWGGDGAVLEVHDFDSANISATLDLNNTGQAVGQVGMLGGYQAFLWQDGLMSILPSLGGPDTLAMAVNDAGQIAGWSDVPSGEHRAVLWQDGEIFELGTYAEGTESYAEDINEAGQVVGTATLVGSLLYTRRATLWHDGTMINLGTLPEGMESLGRAVNEIGQVVGWSWDTVLNRRRAVIWRRNPLTGEWAITDLGALTADGTSRAADINDRGQIVGQAECIGYCGRAFLWENGTMFDLNDLIPEDSGWTLQHARAINDAGQIAGFGRDAEGNREAFLLTPIATRPNTDADSPVAPGDLADLLAQWGTYTPLSEDVDGDGGVGFEELLALLRDWGIQHGNEAHHSLRRQIP